MSQAPKKTEIYDDNTFFGQYTQFTDEKLRLAEFLVGKMEGSDVSHILDLGCFDGELSRRLVAALQAEGRQVLSYTGVEPSEEPLARFQKLQEGMGCQVSLMRSAMEDALSYSWPHRFSWVIASHSLYWSKSLPQVLSDMMNVGLRGAIIIRDPGVLHELEVKFRPAMLADGKIFYSGREIGDALNSVQIPYVKDSFPAQLTIPAVDTPEFANLVGFLLDLRVDQLDTALFPEINKFLGAVDGQLHFVNDVFLIGAAVSSK